MKALRVILTPVFVILLMVSFALTGLSAAFRLTICNPDFYIRMLPRYSYLENMQDAINEETNHIGALYGFEDGALDDLVTTDEIRAYTETYLAAAFAFDNTESFRVAPFSSTCYAEYYSAHTDFGYDAAVEFSEDCLFEAQACMTASSSDLLLGGLNGLMQNRYVMLVQRLIWSLVAVDCAILLMLLVLYIGKVRQGFLWMTGALFMGASTVFAPVAVFVCRRYADKLNIAASALQVQVTAFFRTALTGGMIVAGTMLAATMALLILAIALYVKKRKRTRKKDLTDD